MESQDLRNALIQAAAYLHEGGEQAALELLLTCEPEFIAQHDYTTETGWNGWEPDTFVLHGPRKLHDAFREDTQEAKQITAAFEAIHPERVQVRARFRAVRRTEASWQADLARELPQLGVVDAEFSVED